MRYKQGRAGWLGVALVGLLMVSAFLLAGGLGSGGEGTALAGSRGNDTGTPPQVVSLSLELCAGPGLTGSLGVGDTFTGQATLGLFYLAQNPLGLTRLFVDTGLRATADFNHAVLASFTFDVVPGTAPAFEVVVMPPDGKITDQTKLVESKIIPHCNTVPTTVTATTTQTDTATDTETTTSTSTVTFTTTQVRIVTVGCGFGNIVPDRC